MPAPAARQHADDRDDDQQLDQGESAPNELLSSIQRRKGWGGFVSSIKVFAVVLTDWFAAFPGALHSLPGVSRV
jgi:hypothetical protein